MERQVFVSMTFDTYLSNEQNRIKWKIIDRVIASGLKPRFFYSFVPNEFKDRVIAQSPWGADRLNQVVQECVGAIIIGFPRWTVSDKGTHHSLASEYSHYESGVVRTHGLPMFMALEQGMPWRGAFDGHDHHIVAIPVDATPDWLDLPEFSQPFDDWVAKVSSRKDIFLGYSSEAHGPAQNIKRILENKGATVLDWEKFDPGTILEQIESAAATCSAGVFLFTKTDKLEGEEDKAAPRDNVVFEAGYFAHAKGHRRVLIVLEEGAKMPADLGGAIYASLKDRANAEEISDQLGRFVAKLHS